jgi:hypothetical protein
MYALMRAASRTQEGKRREGRGLSDEPTHKKKQKKHGPPLQTAGDLQSGKGRDERRASVTDPVLRG